MKCFQVSAATDRFVLGFPINERGDLLSTANSASAGPWRSNLLAKDDNIGAIFDLDCIKCPSGLYVSRRAFDALQGLQLSRGSAFIEVQIMDNEKGRIHDAFFFLSPVDRPAVANLRKSSFVPFADGSVWYFTRPVVSYEAVAGIDLVSTLDLAEVCSDQFKARIADHALSGFRFSPCGVDS